MHIGSFDLEPCGWVDLLHVGGLSYGPDDPVGRYDCGIILVGFEVDGSICVFIEGGDLGDLYSGELVMGSCEAYG